MVPKRDTFDPCGARIDLCSSSALAYPPVRLSPRFVTADLSPQPEGGGLHPGVLLQGEERDLSALCFILAPCPNVCQGLAIYVQVWSPSIWYQSP